MRYRYNGSEVRNLPTLGVTVKAGDIIETPVAIVHPEFALLEEQPVTPTHEHVETTPVIEQQIGEVI